MLRSCVPNLVSLRFEFSFIWLKFRADDRSFCVCYVVAFQIRFRCVSNLVSFMNGLRFELCLDHFGVAMLAVRQELESQVRQAC